MLDEKGLSAAMADLAGRFPAYDWVYRDVPGRPGETYFSWYAPEDEQVQIAVPGGSALPERYHHQDFFFLNYAWRGDFQTLSNDPNHPTTVHEGEIYVGQPFTGYGLLALPEGSVIIGVHIRPEAFFRSFLPVVSSSDRLLRFFIDPERDRFSSDYLLLSPDDSMPVRELLAAMVVEYANPRADTQPLLTSLALALLMYVARQYAAENPGVGGRGAADAIVEYMGNHVGDVTLSGLAERFGYHPNYLSGMLRRETGKTFSQIAARQRMERARLLLSSTTLPVEDVSRMVGYADTSNFYKAFRAAFGMSPRAARGADVRIRPVID
ncbi:MAG: helix-turn-helix transcriptional regulator [Atopobiaceae bacterium]|jgi:AraC-like DNA-binding protein|nr:helix-turn-helix transcriptional regulator [Atopobiaceae bacterium]